MFDQVLVSTLIILKTLVTCKYGIFGTLYANVIKRIIMFRNSI